MEKTILLLLAVSLSSNSVLAQGMTEDDIILTPEQQMMKEVTSNPSDIYAPQNAAIRLAMSLWPNGVVPYTFSPDLNSQAQTAIRDAIADYENLTCIQFVPRNAEIDYLNFFPGYGCYSYIGRIGGVQEISIGSHCEFKGIVIHEIFHALGRWHEQSRPDRDTYVRIFPENIGDGLGSNFDIIDSRYATTQGVPYDFDSIMHYRSTAFSDNGQATILPKNSNVQVSRLGQRSGLSQSDVEHVTTLYCGGNGGSWSSWSSWTDCTQTCNGGSRSRSRTCVGGTSCEGTNIMFQPCNTESCLEAIASWGQWSIFSSCSSTCGGGRQERSRSCLGGNTCLGLSAEFRDCNTQDCSEPATWASWSSWSACSRTCQGGFRQRNRLCQNGYSCPGSSFASESCNSNIPCTQNVTTQWSTWSTCDVECGGGQRYRTRNCSAPCETTQTQNCSTHECQPEPELRGLRHHGCWFLDPTTQTIRRFENLTPDLSDNHYTRTNPVNKCGTAAEMYNYTLFALTDGGLCMSGSNILSDYQFFSASYCENGKGGSIFSLLFLDVYEIFDQQSFDESAAQALNRATPAPGTDSTGVETVSSGFKLGYSIVAMFATLIITAVSL